MYRSRFDRALAWGGTTLSPADAHAAHGSIGGALSVAGRPGGASGATVADAAQGVFVDGFHDVGWWVVAATMLLERRGGAGVPAGPGRRRPSVGRGRGGRRSRRMPRRTPPARPPEAPDCRPAMDDSSTAGGSTDAAPRRTFAGVLGAAGDSSGSGRGPVPARCAPGRARATRASGAAAPSWWRMGSSVSTKLSLNGRQVLLELRGAGELVGELNAIDGGQRSATLRVIEAGVVWVLGSAELMQLARTDGDVAAALLVTLSAKVRESAARHLELGTTEALPPRVARRVAELAQLRGGGREVVSPLSQQELADWAGVSRDGVVRSLTWLRQAGVVETGRRRFVILDPRPPPCPRRRDRDA